jgi:hypothetical protein
MAPSGDAPVPAVIYIAGSGRSGSTLLERSLGGIAGFVNVGELIDLFRRVAPRDERCGCGQPFSECTFWTGVGKRAFSGWESSQIAAVNELQGRVARQRLVPRLLAMRFAGQRFRGEISRYGEHYASLYRAIAAESGASYVVDASKWPVQALALSRAGLDVRVIHLIRDVRGVAHSMSKRGVARPHVNDAAHMLHRAPAGAAVRWMLCQSQADLLPHCGLPVTRVRYEDFVRQPRLVVETALSGLGVTVASTQLGHIAGGHITLGASHGLSGNPSRFREGEVSLKPDDAWRERMARRDRIAVMAIGLPQMLRYRRHGPEPASTSTGASWTR